MSGGIRRGRHVRACEWLESVDEVGESEVMGRKRVRVVEHSAIYLVPATDPRDRLLLELNLIYN